MKTETAVGLFVCVALAATLFLMSYLGLLRFDKSHSASYIVPLREAAGLVRRADVRIAGVKVGYVEKIVLSSDQKYPVSATILVDTTCQLHGDACGFVRQDGLLGGRYLEVHPGSIDTPLVAAGGTLVPAAQRGGTVEDLFERFAQVSEEVRTVARTTQQILVNEEYRELMTDVVAQVRDLSEQVALCMRQVRRAAPAFIDEADGVMQDVRTIVDRAQIISEKLERGDGTFGKLLTDDTVYNQARAVGERVVTVINTVEHTQLRVDGWNEWLLQNPLCPAECYNQKSYVSLLLEPPGKFFGLFGLVGAPCGATERWYVVDDLRDCTGQVRIRQELSPYLLNLQLGVGHQYGALRMGLIESTLGAALDVSTDWWRDMVRWETSFWAYDFRGRNRLCDDRPHLKWINRLFLTPSVCFVAGVDDFVSRNTRNIFVGAGISLDETTLSNFFSW